MLPFFSSDTPPTERRHKVLERTHRRIKGALRRSSVRGDIAWNRLVHSVLLMRGPLTSYNVLQALAALVFAVAATAASFTAGWPQEAAYMAGIFVAAALLWVTEALPLFATAILVVGLEILLLGNPGDWAGLGFGAAPTPSYQEFLAPAADPILVLFFGGFLLARACVKEGVDRALAGLILRAFQGRPSLVMLGLMIVTALFSMWMSNTAATAMMITLVTPMTAQIPEGDPIRKGLVLAVPFAANIGGMGTPIASPPNAVAVGFLSSAGYDVSFLQWMLIAIPLTVAMLGVAWVVLRWLYPPATGGLTLRAERRSLDGRGVFVLAVLVVTVGLWLTDRWHGLPTAVVALLPAIAFTATGVLDQTDVDSLEWDILILIGGGIALGGGMQKTGLDQIVVQAVPLGGAFVLGGLVGATVLVSTFMSNTAAANLLIPIGVSFALGATATGGYGPIQIGLSIALAASLSMALPVSTPPNAIAYASGELDTADFARAGGLLGALAVVLIVAFGGPVIAFWVG
ncbi:MAG TPA: DASS family sodium-coupled anion symporter [Salinibacter sp.]|nr:DASS family sodium-coupled anion symporter [Salinibacter sp.]